MLDQRRSKQVRLGMLFSTNTNTNTNHSWKNAQTRLCDFFAYGQLDTQVLFLQFAVKIDIKDG